MKLDFNKGLAGFLCATTLAVFTAGCATMDPRQGRNMGYSTGSILRDVVQGATRDQRNTPLGGIIYNSSRNLPRLGGTIGEVATENRGHEDTDYNRTRRVDNTTGQVIYDQTTTTQRGHRQGPYQNNP